MKTYLLVSRGPGVDVPFVDTFKSLNEALSLSTQLELGGWTSQVYAKTGKITYGEAGNIRILLMSNSPDCQQLLRDMGIVPLQA